MNPISPRSLVLAGAFAFIAASAAFAADVPAGGPRKLPPRGPDGIRQEVVEPPDQIPEAPKTDPKTAPKTDAKTAASLAAEATTALEAAAAAVNAGKNEEALAQIKKAQLAVSQIQQLTTKRRPAADTPKSSVDPVPQPNTPPDVKNFRPLPRDVVD